MSDELLTACKQVMQRFPDAKIRRRPDDAIEIRSARFVGLVRAHGNVVVGHTQGREHRAQVKSSLKSAVLAVTLKTPLTRESAVNMVAAAVRTRPIEGQSPLGQKFRVWRDNGYHGIILGESSFSTKTPHEIADWIVTKVGRRAAAKATGERVRAAPQPAVQTTLAAMRARIPALQQAIKEIEHSVGLLEKDPAKYAPQIRNLADAFKSAYGVGRSGMKLVETLTKQLG